MRVIISILLNVSFYNVFLGAELVEVIPRYPRIDNSLGLDKRLALIDHLKEKCKIQITPGESYESLVIRYKNYCDERLLSEPMPSTREKSEGEKVQGKSINEIEKIDRSNTCIQLLGEFNYQAKDEQTLIELRAILRRFQEENQESIRKERAERFEKEQVERKNKETADKLRMESNRKTAEVAEREKIKLQEASENQRKELELINARVSRDEFRKKIMGKNLEKLTENVGKPDKTDDFFDRSRKEKWLYYNNKTFIRDPRKPDDYAKVIMEENQVVRIYFYE